MTAPITLYTHPWSRGRVARWMLEETGLPYRVHHIDIGAGDQFKPAFLAISPNNKIPAIVDADGIDGKPMSMFESGAILLYLASKTGMFLGQTDRDPDGSDESERQCACQLDRPLPLHLCNPRAQSDALKHLMEDDDDEESHEFVACCERQADDDAVQDDADLENEDTD